MPSTAVTPFIPIRRIEEPTTAPAVVPAPPVRTRRHTRRAIEIDFGGGRRLKVDVDVDALSRVLDVLDRR